MVTIPRYRQHTQVPLAGLRYSTAFGRTMGDDLHEASQALGAASSIASSVSSLKWGGTRAGDEKDRGGGDTAGPGALVEAREALADWGDQVAGLMRQESAGPNDRGAGGFADSLAALGRTAAKGLSGAARAMFEAEMAQRQARLISEASVREAEALDARAMDASRRLEAQGVDDYLRQADLDEGLGRIALASAVAQRGARLRAAGHEEADVRDAQRQLLAEVEHRRIDLRIGDDPEAAAALLERQGGVLPEAQHKALAAAIDAERIRREASRVVGELVGEGEGLADDLDTLLARVNTAAGDNANRQLAYRSAALGAWRMSKARRDAVEDAAWREIMPFLEPKSGVGSWTEVPGPIWAGLSPRQRESAKAWFDQPLLHSSSTTLNQPARLTAPHISPFQDTDPESFKDRLASDYAFFRSIRPAEGREDPIRPGMSAYPGPASLNEIPKANEAARLAADRWKSSEPLLTPASYAAPEPPIDRWTPVPPQAFQTFGEKRLNARLAPIKYPDGLFFNEETGQIFKIVLRYGDDPFNKLSGRYVAVLASDDEARDYRRHRLGVESSEPGTSLQEELALNRLATRGNRDWIPEDGDENRLARMIFAEGADTPEDQVAIGWSIINRVGHPEHGETLTAVLRDPKGFQIVPEGGGPPGGSPLWRLSGTPEKMTGPNKTSWENALRVAKGILSGRIDDPVDGGRFFYSSDKVYNSNDYKTAFPGWFQDALRRGAIVQAPYKSQATGKIKNYFFRDKDLR